MEKKSLICMRWGFVFVMGHIRIGRVDLLPDFAGFILFILAVRAHEKMSAVEERMEPFLWILAADALVKWLTGFSNNLEELFITVIGIYAFYVLIGEVMLRIGEKQPEVAGSLHGCRIAFVILYAANFLIGSYEIEMVNVFLVAAFLISAVYLFLKTFAVVPLEDEEEREAPCREEEKI